MSNYVRGTIDSDVDFLIIGRTVVAQDKIYYGTYAVLDDPETDGKRGFFGSLMDYQSYAKDAYANLKLGTFRYSQSTNELGFMFSRTGTLNKLDSIDALDTTIPIVTSANDDSTAFTEHTKSVATKTADPETLFLNPHLPLDKRILFSGTWYSLSDKYDNILKYNWFDVTPKVINGFNPNVTDTPATSLIKTDIMFVPFTFYGWKVINGNYKSLDSASDFMKYVDGWIKGDSAFNQKGCEGKLTQKDATNCIFTMGDIKGLVKSKGFAYGWRYCNNGEACSDGCFGKCEEHVSKDSERCGWSTLQHRFICGDDVELNDPEVLTKDSRRNWIKVAVMILLILLFIGIVVYFVVKYR